MSGETGKWIILAGLVILLAGIVVYFFHDKLHWLGNLPLPFTTMIIISLIINLIIRLFR